MKSSIVVLKLSKDDVLKLQQMVKDGRATDFEKKMYYSTYELNEQDQSDSVTSYL